MFRKYLIFLSLKIGEFYLIASMNSYSNPNGKIKVVAGIGEVYYQLLPPYVRQAGRVMDVKYSMATIVMAMPQT